MKNESGRWVAVGVASTVLGCSETRVWQLVKEGHLPRRAETKGFDIVTLLKLREQRSKRGIHRGRPTQRESMLATTSSLLAQADRHNLRATS